MKNIIIFYLKSLIFLVIKFSVYLNRRVFVMELSIKKVELGMETGQSSVSLI